VVGQILRNSDFLEIGELWSTYFDVFRKPLEKGINHQNFLGQRRYDIFLYFTYFDVFRKLLRKATSNKICLGQSSETKKLLGNHILKFGSDFFKTCKLWSTCFVTFEKRSETTTKNPNNFGQNLKKQKKL